MNAERASGYVLLVAAVTGAALGPKAPHRWGRAGGGLLLAGLSALLARDVAMIASGALRRLRPLPKVLLFAETMSAGTGIAMGARPWLMADPPQPVALTGRAGSGLTTATFTIHAIRQLIYLTAGQGRSGPLAAPPQPLINPGRSQRTGSALLTSPAPKLIIAVNLRHTGSARAGEPPVAPSHSEKHLESGGPDNAGLTDAEPSRSAISRRDKQTRVNTKSAQPPRVPRSRSRHRDDGRSAEMTGQFRSPRGESSLSGVDPQTKTRSAPA